MQIKIQNLIPKPLVGTNQSGSDLWLKEEIVFKTNTENLVLSESGKGKSSLVSFLYGSRSDYEGKIFFDSQLAQNLNFSEWIKLRIDTLSIVFQDLKLFSNLTAIENIQLKNKLTDFKSEAEIQQMAQQLEVDMLLHRSAATLSYGQQQRIAILRAMCQPFKWIFLDEPFSHLDKVNIGKAMELIRNEATKQNAAILITLLHPEPAVKPNFSINI